MSENFNYDFLLDGNPVEMYIPILGLYVLRKDKE